MFDVIQNLAYKHNLLLSKSLQETHFQVYLLITLDNTAVYYCTLKCTIQWSLLILNSELFLIYCESSFTLFTEFSFQKRHPHITEQKLVE